MRAFLAIALMALLSGCATLSGGGGKGQVRELHLFGLPITLDLDGKPGADGFAVRIYVTKAGSAKGALISNGAIEILMFDGVAGGDDIVKRKPDQTWKFSSNELAKYEEESSLGHGYKFALRWAQMPRRNHITVVARYATSKGEAIYSSPSTITAAAQ